MQISVKHLPKSLVELTIEATPAELEPARIVALKELQKEVKIAGFRPGKIPLDVLIEKVGAAVIERETLNHAIPLLYTEAVKNKELKVISRPTVKIESTTPFKFVAQVAVLPEVKLGDYKKIKIKKEKTELGKQELEDFLKHLRKRHAVAKEIKSRAAKKGDRVEVDFAGFTPDGVSLEKTNSKNHPLTLGENVFVPGFEEGVVGMQLEEEKEHTVKFPADYHAKHLANQDVKFKIKLKKIEEMEEPELSDTFAETITGGQKKKWSEVETEIRTGLLQEKTTAAAQKLENELMAELLKICEVEIPEILITEEVVYMLQDFKERLESGGLDFDKYLIQSKKTEEQIQKEMTPEAEKRVKLRLILDKLVEAEKITIPSAELENEIKKASQRYPEAQQKKFLEAFAADSANRTRLQHQLKVIKLLGELTKTLSHE